MKTTRELYQEHRSKYPNGTARNALNQARSQAWVLAQEERTDIKIELFVDYYDLPVRGNCIASGCDALDKKTEDELINRLESGDVWAWADVEVRVSLLCPTCGNCRTSASEYLGGCSYASEAEFKTCGYYRDLISACLSALEVE